MNEKQSTPSLHLKALIALALIATLGTLHITPAGAGPLTPGNPIPSPDPNAHDAPPGSVVSITYDEAIDPNTVNPQTFAVHATLTGWLTQTLTVNGGTIRLAPPEPFRPGEFVQVSATTGTLSQVDGNPPASPTVWQFRVAVGGGSGRFSDSGQTLTTGSINSAGIALADLDGDGDLDAFEAASGPNRIWLNDGTGTFSDSGQSLGAAMSSDVALGDLDGDGDLDAFVANNSFPGQANKVWLNDGSASFTDSGQSLGAFISAQVSLGDVDGDGDLDAFIANSSNQANRVWFNNGSGTFTDSGQTLGSAWSEGLALGDLDGDGDLDALVANNLGVADKVWLNNGAGTFSDSGQSLGNWDSLGAALGDVDEDGDLDAITSGLGITVWINDGSGSLTASGPAMGSLPGSSVEVGDLDGDGDLDLFVANTMFPGGNPNQVWLNQGGAQNGTYGTFADSGQSLAHAVSQDVALADVDGDGDLDAFVVNWGEANRLWLNWNRVQSASPAPNSHQAAQNTNLTVSIQGGIDPASGTDQSFVVHGGFQGRVAGAYNTGGNIVFNPQNDFHPGELVATTLTSGIQAGGSPLYPFVWQFHIGVTGGSGRYTPDDQDLGAASTMDVAVGDLDGDGDLDAVTANILNTNNAVWVNDGLGVLTTTQSLEPSNTKGVALGDLDGDADLDAFFANGDTQPEPDTIWLNDGSGTFTDSGQSLGTATSRAVALGDLDGDGDLDAFTAQSGPNQVWLNDGTGTFSAYGGSLGSGNSTDVALGDLDGDGDLDAVVANYGVNTVWLNDGEANFTPFNLGADYSISTEVMLGDLDGDGDLDAFFVNYSEGHEIWLNDGSGTLTDSGQSLGTAASYGGSLGDVDNDGDLDAFIANYGQANKIWRNNGSGVFSDGGQDLGDAWSWAVALGDLEGDGDLDALVANSALRANKIWRNEDQIRVYLPAIHR